MKNLRTYEISKIHCRQFLMLISLAVMLLSTACGSKSSKQRIIGSIDANYCAERGQIFIPANSEAKIPARCTPRSNAESVCHFQNKKLDSATNECVPATEGDFRFAYLSESNSMYAKAAGEIAHVCLGGRDFLALDSANQQVLADNVKRATEAWLDPVKDLAEPALAGEVHVIAAPSDCPSDHIATVNVVSNIVANCGLPRGGCANPGTAEIFLDSQIGVDLPTLLHEFGHLVGLNDYYYDLDQHPEAEHDPVIGCLKGFFGSVMCTHNSQLGPADIVAAKRIYCSYSESSKCPKPTSLDGAHFGDAMAVCSGTTGGEVDVSTLGLSILYSQDARLKSEFPYSAKFTFTSSDGSDNWSETLAVDTRQIEAPEAPFIKMSSAVTGTELSWALATGEISGAMGSGAHSVVGLGFWAKSATDNSCSQINNNLRRLATP